ncbi:TPA: preprotein translocase subunit SecY [Patescibacteria group bacterium]|nr:MAG: Protein translocase subunit SecY [Parcubacteria group bacterium GW2011_GWF2_40_10]KKR47422.1 MAG: Protein translocase subunit SecY [Parcubacteria group bacterium GW2011_GWA2_40_143]KKR59822.1 MAG: Protein translocase subunit SecY [Parcubacteria group bacterium GW2011_GWC2_40_31]KKR77187.1 MAG: Protein translocase subunit SecY [Parcubacteria group bacterium GW2011_GWE2_40_8]KKR80802.1 MAG: Protein translocase subunit SecY [Parcubacteria group bacterium GW2011_GWD2_40_9]HBB56619.1 prepro
MLNRIKIILKDKDLRKKILFVLFALVLFRLGANIPIPGVDQARLEAFMSGNQLFGLLDIFSGGGLSNLSVMMLGVGPYITASIIMQLFTMIFPKLKEIYQEEGEAGRQKFNQYTRLLTLPLAFMQGFGLMALLQSQGILGDLSIFDKLTNIAIMISGTMILLWLGELITEKKVGNGISLIIFAGIVASLPNTIRQLIFTFDPSQIPVYAMFIASALLIIAGVVFISEAERSVPVSYAKQIRGSKMYGGSSTHIPLRVNQAGVIPIIFAISILLFPQMIAGFLSSINNGAINIISGYINIFMNNLWMYGAAYFILVFFFTYFYTAVTFDPHMISTNLQKGGAFIPGIRPGQPTSDYLSRIIGRITLVGALFLGLIAVLPLGMQAVTGLSTLAIGGTALLIVVSVVLETSKQIEAQVVMKEY